MSEGNNDSDNKGWGGKRRAVLSTAAAVVVIAFALTAFLLSAPSKKQAPVVDAKPKFDECRMGKVVSADDSKLVLKTASGPSREYEVREEYLAVLDIPHMREHSALGQSTLIYSYADGKQSVAIKSDDAPLSIADAPPCKP